VSDMDRSVGIRQCRSDSITLILLVFFAVCHI
jgi:hypothetical protein